MNQKYITSGQRTKGFIEVDPVVAPTILIYQADEYYDILRYYMPLNHIKPVFATKEIIKEQLISSRFDIAIIDYYDEPNSLELLDIARLEKPDVPIVLLVNYDSGSYELEAFKRGVDLFLTRPYNIEVLILQLQALARRNKHTIRELPQNNFIIADCQLDIENACLIRLKDKYFIPLAPVEVEIMKLVCAYYKEGEIPKLTMLNQIFGSASALNKKNLEVRISMLRKKLQGTNIYIKANNNPPYRGYQLGVK